jgi:hypothetical protein
MEEEYRWLASQGIDDSRESDEKYEYLFPSPPSLPPPYPPPPPFHDPEHQDDQIRLDDSLSYQYYFQQSPPSSPPLPSSDHPPPLEFYDIDLMRSSIGDIEQPNDHFQENDEKDDPEIPISKSHLEVAVIEIHENSSESNSDQNEIEQFSVLKIGDRVYAVTTSLVLFLQNFILSGSRFLLRSYLNIEIPAQTQEKIQEISDLSLRALNQLSTLKALGECLTESCYFAADRTRTYTKW